MVGAAKTGFEKQPFQTDKTFTEQVQFAVQAYGLLAFVLKVDLQVVLKIFTYSGEFMQDFNAGVSQCSGRSDTGKLKQMRRPDRTG